ncbi:adenylyl-sulfate kinase [Evansella sp. AB-P1]|uniref:adenylyl-sulfate kinase n=1 Tax=Evansella sp. AB-P1 TaxID=3037653 RepID=UPI00241E7E1B|nr:adenylyl-sulfate kinase [Evansella sp. AB-P1]MDG5787204.1 adenylyl-sulfate kinase [Evansella sp. AB-P1]
MKKNQHIVWHHSKVTKDDRRSLNKHSSCILWFTGLSGSGKSTLACEVEKELFQRNILSYVLDGDNIRHGLNNNLGFSQEDRKENIRRIGEVSKLFVDAGIFTLAAFISPYKDDRQIVREMVDKDEFIEIYVKCTVDECERRDTKGLYEKARKGEIKEFTGISAPYEVPENPEIVIESDQQRIEDSVDKVLIYLVDKGYINP